jgi:hypothetical protein
MISYIKKLSILWQMRKTKLQRYKNMFNPANHVVFNTIRRKQRLLYELSNGSCRPKSTDQFDKHHIYQDF